MIPKIIHYCWFGGNEKSPLIKRCIESWKIFCPDYEIKEWKDNIFCCEVKQNEDEFNNDSDRVKDAVRERHYLFGVNLYSIQSEAAKLSVFIRKDGFVREEQYVFTQSGRKLVYRNQHRNWYCENNEWLYTV